MLLELHTGSVPPDPELLANAANFLPLQGAPHYEGGPGVPYCDAGLISKELIKGNGCGALLLPKRGLSP